MNQALQLTNFTDFLCARYSQHTKSSSITPSSEKVVF